MRDKIVKEVISFKMSLILLVFAKFHQALKTKMNRVIKDQLFYEYNGQFCNKYSIRNKIPKKKLNTIRVVLSLKNICYLIFCLKYNALLFR